MTATDADILAAMLDPTLTVGEIEAAPIRPTSPPYIHLTASDGRSRNPDTDRIRSERVGSSPARIALKRRAVRAIRPRRTP